jgi:thioredoxin reductase (NADPH)
MDTLIIEKQKFGGQIVITDEIENYPGSVEGETGPSLMARMVAQADKFGCERVEDTITAVELEGDVKIIKGNKGEYHAKAVIITGGEVHKNIGCPGEKEFTGKGVSYCATCDAAFFEDFEVYVVGGGDAAVEEAMYLTRFARKVTLIHRRDELRAARSIQEKAFANPKMEFMWNTTIEEIRGDGVVESMVVKDTQTGETREIFADEEDGTFGIFVFIGYTPSSEIYEGIIDMERGYILTDEEMRTNIPGVFAAGDLRTTPLRQVIIAAADGAVGAVYAVKYIESLEHVAV